MDKKQAAMELHDRKFNCAQSTFAAFAEDVGMDTETALKVSTCFGGGMRCGEVCGAVTGALMAIGMRFGSSKENDYDKTLAYEKELEFIRQFKERNGYLRCMDLFGYDVSDPEQLKIVNEKGLRKICIKAINDAVEITEELLK